MGDTRTLDVHVCTLRRKIETVPSRPVLIRTIRRVGYRFEVAKEKPKRSK
jgi:DNA-binding response OmpR family regulator